MPQLAGPSVSKIQRQYWYCVATPHRATGHDLLHNVVVAVDIVHLAHGHLVVALHRHAAAAAAVLARVHAVAIEVVGLVPIRAISIIIKPKVSVSRVVGVVHLARDVGNAVVVNKLVCAAVIAAVATAGSVLPAVQNNLKKA
jgi:hypothetical protein